MKKIKAGVSALLNALSVVLTAAALVQFFAFRGEGNMAVAGVNCFRYFTVDSNILSALCGIPIIVYDIRLMTAEKEGIPGWAKALKLTGTASVMVTFWVVVCFLGPLQGYGKMYAGQNLNLHLICPLCAAVSFALCETDSPIPWKTAWLSEIPTVLYGAVYFVMVIVIGAENGGWFDFYGFNRGGMWYVAVVAMLLATAAIGFGLCAVQRFFAAREKRKD